MCLVSQWAPERARERARVSQKEPEKARVSQIEPESQWLSEPEIEPNRARDSCQEWARIVVHFEAKMSFYALQAKIMKILHSELTLQFIQPWQQWRAEMGEQMDQCNGEQRPGAETLRRERAVSCAAAVERDTWLSSFCLLVITVTDQIAYFDARLFFLSSIEFTDIASRWIMNILNETPQKLYLKCNN